MADDDRGRDVVLPLRLYKTVIVFSTLFAVAFVIGGFLVLDVATQRASLPPNRVDAPLALLGVALVGAGGAVYAFASRFRAEGMGRDKSGPDEPPGDG